jgi:hypothetical protein
MRELRRRRRKGLIQYRVEADDYRLAGALIASERLSPEETLHRNLVERELCRVVEDFIDRWPLKNL